MEQNYSHDDYLRMNEARATIKYLKTLKEVYCNKGLNAALLHELKSTAVSAFTRLESLFDSDEITPADKQLMVEVDRKRRNNYDHALRHSKLYGNPRPTRESIAQKIPYTPHIQDKLNKFLGRKNKRKIERLESMLNPK